MELIKKVACKSSNTIVKRSTHICKLSKICTHIHARTQTQSDTNTHTHTRIHTDTNTHAEAKSHTHIHTYTHGCEKKTYTPVMTLLIASSEPAVKANTAKRTHALKVCACV